uniref:Dipeptidyl-peptidase III n=1 Tax=Trepomonas sp. PC1 TaxID=1076344 RepID=A0A146K9H5_9EUKA|eukprot:JAP92988.1 Dipeptidyl-peptidase III [Trepomonas sp. PC1]
MEQNVEQPERNIPMIEKVVPKIYNQLTEHEKMYLYHLSLACYSYFPIIIGQIDEKYHILYAFFKLFIEKLMKDEAIMQRILDRYDEEFILSVYHIFSQSMQFFMCPRNYEYDLDVQSISCLEAFGEDVVEQFQLVLEVFGEFVELQSVTGKIPLNIVKQINDVYKKLPENTMIVETETTYTVKVASVVNQTEATNHQINGKQIVIQHGNFSSELQKSIQHLRNAQKYCSNAESSALDSLIKHYETGDMDYFLEYNALWVQIKNPKIEVNMGFVETTHDPLNCRSDMEGWIAVRDFYIDQQFKFLSQPELIEELMNKVPMPSYVSVNFDNFPQFSPANILVFAQKDNIIGKNLPNYEQITDQFGSKNFSFVNRIQPKTLLGITDQGLALRALKYVKLVNILTTSLHEVFGHGSKAFVFEEDFNQLNEEQKAEIKTFYHSKEDVRLQMKDYRNFLEECRAEATSYYLMFNQQIAEYLQIDDNEAFTAALVSNLVLYTCSSPRYVLQKETYSLARMAIFQKCIEPLQIVGEDGGLQYDAEKLAQLTENLRKMTYKLNLLMVGGNFEDTVELFQEVIKRVEENLDYYVNVSKSFRASKYNVKSQNNAIQPVLILDEGLLKYHHAKTRIQQTVADTYATIHNVELATDV